MGGTPRSTPASLWATQARWSQVGGREMHLCRKRGQLSGSPGHGERPTARLGAPRSHSGDSTSPNCHWSPLLPWSHRLLLAICKEFCSHCGSFTRSDQEGCGLPLERRLPDRLRPSQDAPHNQSYHCLPGLQLGLSAIYRRIDCRSRCDPGSSPRWQGAHHLLRFKVPQPGWEGLPRHQIGVLGHCLGGSQIPAISHGHAVRGLYRPLRTPMAKDDEDWVGTPSPLVCSAGWVRLHHPSSSREGPNPCWWAQPVAGWPRATWGYTPPRPDPRQWGGG